MAKCDCGADVRRTLTTFDKSAKAFTTICPECHPESFDSDPFLTPADRKIWRHEDACPEMYDKRGDVLVAKDKLHADTAAMIAKDPDEEARLAAIERKRRNRRTTPMTQAEIEQAERQWIPIVQQMKKENDEAWANSNQALQEMIDKYVGPQPS